MQPLYNLKDGDVVSFFYKGEKDNSPRKRLVRVKGVDGTGTYQLLKSSDLLDGDKYKQFNAVNITPNSLRVVGDKNTVVKTGDEAASHFSNVSRKVQLAGLQEVVKSVVPGAESVVHDDELDAFIVKTKPQNKSGFSVGVQLNDSNTELTKVVLTWFDREGKALDWDFTKQQDYIRQCAQLLRILRQQNAT